MFYFQAQRKWPRGETAKYPPEPGQPTEEAVVKKSSVPAHPTKAPAPRLPDHELIRLDAAAHPERTPSEHEAAARGIAGRTYLEDLRRISPAAQAALSLELEADGIGL
jgi:hypothetical protein